MVSLEHRMWCQSTFAVQAQYRYDPWGVKTNVVTESVASDFQFAGMYCHERSSLILALYRQYHPSLDRWLTRDPIGESVNANLYNYVGNCPLSFTDPLGLGPWEDFLVATPVVPRQAVDAVAGFGDVASFGATDTIRDIYGGN